MYAMQGESRGGGEETETAEGEESVRADPRLDCQVNTNTRLERCQHHP